MTVVVDFIVVNSNPRRAEEPTLGLSANKLDLSWTWTIFPSSVSLYADLNKCGMEAGAYRKEKQLRNKHGNRKEKRERNGKGRGGP